MVCMKRMSERREAKIPMTLHSNSVIVDMDGSVRRQYSWIYANALAIVDPCFCSEERKMGEGASQSLLCMVVCMMILKDISMIRRRELDPSQFSRCVGSSSSRFKPRQVLSKT